MTKRIPTKDLSWPEIVDQILQSIPKAKPAFKEWLLTKSYLKYHFLSPNLYYHLWLTQKDVIENNTDYLAAVCGIEGSGKSTLAIQMAYVLDPTFSRENLILNLDKFRERLQEQKDNKIRQRCYVIDEGINVVGTEKARRRTNIQFNELLRKMRYLNNYIFVCMPDYKGLTPYVRKHRVKNALFIFDNRKGWRSFNVWTKEGLWILNEQLDKGRLARSIRRGPPYMWRADFNGKIWPEINGLDREKYESFKDDDLQQSLNATKEVSESESKSEYIDIRKARKIFPASEEVYRDGIKKGKFKGKKFGGKYYLHRESLENYVLG